MINEKETTGANGADFVNTMADPVNTLADPVNTLEEQLKISCDDARWGLLQLKVHDFYLQQLLLMSLQHESGGLGGMTQVVSKYNTKYGAKHQEISLGRATKDIRYAKKYISSVVEEYKDVWSLIRFDGVNQATGKVEGPDDFLDAPIRNVINQRMANVLRRIGIRNVRELVYLDSHGFNLKMCYGIGPTSIQELQSVLSEHFVTLQSIGAKKKMQDKRTVDSWKRRRGVA